MKSRQLFGQIGALIALALVFVIVSYTAHHYKDQLAGVIGIGSVTSVAVFILLTASFVIFVIPLDIVFLIPIGSAVWGAVPTALMSITGWTIGYAAAFLIARKFGIGIVGKLIGLERVRVVERRVPKRNLFGMVILLRMLVSVDVLSYALGLFSAMPLGQYVLATLIGVAPFGFYFAYSGTLPFWYQLAAIGTAIILATAVLLKYGLRREP